MERFNEFSPVQRMVLSGALANYVQVCQANEDMTKALNADLSANWRQMKIASSELRRELTELRC